MISEDARFDGGVLTSKRNLCGPAPFHESIQKTANSLCQTRLQDDIAQCLRNLCAANIIPIRGLDQ
eukprot:gene16739-19899_t